MAVVYVLNELLFLSPKNRLKAHCSNSESFR